MKLTKIVIANREYNICQHSLESLQRCLEAANANVIDLGNIKINAQCTCPGCRADYAKEVDQYGTY